MVAARTSEPGLSPADLERIRDTLASGRKPKVAFTQLAGQIVGQVGQVVALTDPQLSEEWLVVRFGRDELPFAPADLSMNVKVPPRRSAAVVPSPREEPALSPTPSPAGGERPQPPAAPAAAQPAAQPAPPAGGERGPQPKAAIAPPAVPASSAGAATRGGEPKAPRKPVRQKPAPSLTVTLGYADGEWMVSATQGTKALAKPYLVRPAEALKMVSMLDVPGVHEAVEEIVSAARTEAQQQADRLRAELAEVEARLADLREQP
jgi:hypothetical protein